jgi:hypothetical protein
VHGDRVQHPLHRLRTAFDALDRRIVGHPLEQLEEMALGALVLIDRHSGDEG